MDVKKTTKAAEYILQCIKTHNTIRTTDIAAYSESTIESAVRWLANPYFKKGPKNIFYFKWYGHALSLRFGKSFSNLICFDDVLTVEHLTETMLVWTRGFEKDRENPRQHPDEQRHRNFVDHKIRRMLSVLYHKWNDNGCAIDPDEVRNTCIEILDTVLRDELARRATPKRKRKLSTKNDHNMQRAYFGRRQIHKG